MIQFQENIERCLLQAGVTCVKDANVKQLYQAISHAAMEELAPRWTKTEGKKRACYLSAEFLLGRLIYSNLMNLGLLEEATDYLQKNGISPTVFEQIEDDALGNGGLGRLAACFLDSAASQDIALDGYGIRYRYGLFKQKFEDGFQKEYPDDWTRFGDPWSVRREEESVLVRFADQTVRAVAYDMPVIGWGGKCVNTLRLWQSEPVDTFDLTQFNGQDYIAASQERILAEAISAVLYPNDDTLKGKQLRLKQQYFFASASIQSILRQYRRTHGDDFAKLPESFAIQLNDTHPVIAIPELLRILCEEYTVPFEQAFAIARETFAYTNHTIMAEALEKWDIPLFLSVAPHVYPYVVMLHNRLRLDLSARGISKDDQASYLLIDGRQIHMARMAIYASHSVNGVAKIHTEILKTTALSEWYRLYPERFNNKTNGITQRRWLALCNRELSSFITDRLGSGWITNLDELEGLKKYADDPHSLQQLLEIKQEKKRQLAQYVQAHDNFCLNTQFLFDIQVKRLHEYKR